MPLTTIGRLALALVFVAAAVGKLADRQGTAAAAEGLGVPRRWAAPIGAAALPAAELAVAAALLWRPTAAVGAAGALFLLALLTGLVVLSLRRGRRPPCHCFGPADDAPIGAVTVARNLALMALAVAVIVGA